MTIADDTETEVIATRDPAAGLPGRVKLPGYEVEIGPVAHLAEERTRLASLTWKDFDVVLQSATIGAEIRGVDLTRTLPDEIVADIQQALWEYKVVFFRDQPLGPEQHVRFAARFGELEIHPFIPSNTGVPELVRFEKDAVAGGYENGWHHDVTWRRAPSQGAILHAIQVPQSGGDTLFSDGHAAYLGLDEDTKDLIDGMVAVHDFQQAFGRQVPEERKAELREQYPLVEHPVVIAHPHTGRPLLYVNRYFLHHVVGLDLDESRALVDRLCRQFELVEYQCRFRWEPHSVAFWDNRAVQHYAASDYYPDIRVMERASIVGDVPTAYTR